MTNMTRYLLLFIALAVGLNAREIKNGRFGFKVVFPDEPGWSTVTHKSASLESQSWSAESEAARLVLIFTAIVNPESDRTTYLERLGACDFFVCPFPYGNMNSIIDAMIMGVPGVCLDGEEAHAHADVAIFQRLGLPAELATADLEAYITAAVRMIDDKDWRAHCRDIASNIDLEKGFYTGDERLFCEAVYGLLPVTVPA